MASNPTQAPPVSGPVGIAVQVGDVFWQLGPIFTLYLAGLLSANLALVNILPFPPLDGGRMLVILLRSLFAAAGGPAASRLPRHGPSAETAISIERLTYLVGFVFLFGFLIWITLLRRRPPGDRRHAVTEAERLRPVRRRTVSVDVGGVLVGSAHPIVVQSMTNTDTADADATALQVVRLAARRLASWSASPSTRRRQPRPCPEIVRKVRDLGVGRPDHRRLPLQRPSAPGGLPGDGPARWRSTGSTPATSAASATTSNFQTIVRVAVEHDKPVRIGVNWGSLDQALLTELMEANAAARDAARRAAT